MWTEILIGWVILSLACVLGWLAFMSGAERSPEPQAAVAEPDVIDWMARLYAAEVRYWAQHLDAFEMRLPSLRRNRLGDAGSLQMVRAVLAAIRATQGRDIAREACGRLMARWRDGGDD